jgi:hypothetical protein
LISTGMDLLDRSSSLLFLPWPYVQPSVSVLLPLARAYQQPFRVPGPL